MDNMANILIGPTWIDHGPLELSHKSGKYFRKSGCWSFCPGIIILYLQSTNSLLFQSNWGLSFTVPGVIIAGVGFLLFLVMVPRPQDLGFLEEVGKLKCTQIAHHGFDHHHSRICQLRVPRPIPFLMMKRVTKKTNPPKAIILKYRQMLQFIWN